MKDLKGILFPPQKRQWRAGRAARIALRTIHLVCFSALFGGHLFGIPPAELAVWLHLTVFSGAGLMALELYGSFDWLLHLAGVLVLVKLIILGLIPLLWKQRVALLTIAVVISSVGSHMPSALRHLRLFPARRNL